MTRGWALGLPPLLLLAACTGGTTDGGAPAPATAADYDALEPCPEQSGPPADGAETLPPLTFDCLGGGALDLGQAPGVPTLVNLWASWCTPCRAELPLLQEFTTVAGDRVRVVGVISKDGLPQAASLAEDLDISFPGAFDEEGELMAELGSNALPLTYFLDADGGLAHTERGQVDSVEELRGLVSEHLGVQL